MTDTRDTPSEPLILSDGFKRLGKAAHAAAWATRAWNRAWNRQTEDQKQAVRDYGLEERNEWRDDTH